MPGIIGGGGVSLPVDHTDPAQVANVGANTHVQIDAHIAAGEAPSDYPYLGFGADAGLSAEVDITLLQLVNEVMNFPSLESADGTQPEWWEVSSATLTEEDTAGEGITENYERCLKVVAAGNNYAYQRYTYADQPRIKAGRVLSVIFAVWSVGGVNARVRLQSSVGSLAVSADTVVAGWTILTVNGAVLDGTYVEVRLEVDTGTAYFVPLGINIGARAVPLKPRGLRYRRSTANPTIENISGWAEKAFANVDLTANTSPLAARAQLQINMYDANAGEQYSYHVRPNGTALGPDNSTKMGGVWGTGSNGEANQFAEICDDGQVIETALVRDAGAATVNYCVLFLLGWWEWD